MLRFVIAPTQFLVHCPVCGVRPVALLGSRPDGGLTIDHNVRIVATLGGEEFTSGKFRG